MPFGPCGGEPDCRLLDQPDYRSRPLHWSRTRCRTFPSAFPPMGWSSCAGALSIACRVGIISSAVGSARCSTPAMACIRPLFRITELLTHGVTFQDNLGIHVVRGIRLAAGIERSPVAKPQPRRQAGALGTFFLSCYSEPQIGDITFARPPSTAAWLCIAGTSSSWLPYRHTGVENFEIFRGHEIRCDGGVSRRGRVAPLGVLDPAALGLTYEAGAARRGSATDPDRCPPPFA